MSDSARYAGRSLLKRRPYLPYVGPAMTIMILLIAIPILAVVFMSFTNYELAMPLDKMKMIGFKNYQRMFAGPNKVFYYSMGISLGMMVIATAIQMILGYLCATLLNQDIKGKALAIACLIVPIAITPSIASQVWKLMLNANSGVINYFLQQLFHTSVVWLDQNNALLSVLIVNIWISTPYVTLILYAGLRSLPMDPYESAIVEGANAWQLFTRITLPLLKPLILLTLLLRSIDMLKMFDIPYVLTQGGPGNITEFIGLHIYRTGFGVNTFVGRASAISVVLIVVVGLICLMLIRLMRRADER